MKKRAFEDFLEIERACGTICDLENGRSRAVIPGAYGVTSDTFRRQARGHGFKTRIAKDGRVVIMKKLEK